MSGVPEQEFFADGMVDDIITALSRYPSLFVIARNSSFTYKGRAVDVKQIGRELGVRYVLEGSVRKVGNRVRVTAQLVEAEAGNHVWANRYDRDLADIFALQDEITNTPSWRIRSGSCACPASGHAAAPPRAVTNSRRPNDWTRICPTGSSTALDATQDANWDLDYKAALHDDFGDRVASRRSRSRRTPRDTA
jgi:TolB-like protein